MAVPSVARGLLSVTVLASLAVACGARGPLDQPVVIIEEPEAGLDAAPVIDASPDAGQDAAPPGFDGGPVVNCVSCIGQNCGTTLISCVTNTSCLAALQCVTGVGAADGGTGCLSGSGGSPNLGCALGCTNGNATTEGQLLSIFTCVAGTCGSSCTSVLGSLGSGGLGGLGGGSTGGTGVAPSGG